jgi:ADP-ribose pyrophosphatase YjhB (NUDIX family)
MKNIPRDQPCPDCGRYVNRAMTIDAVIVKGNRILLIKRGAETYHGYWALPGGYSDWDEDITGSVLREVKEELNVQGKVVRLIGLYSQPRRSPHQTISAAFEVEIDDEPTAGDDAVECKWVDLDKLPSELAFDHAQIIEDYKNHTSCVY